MAQWPWVGERHSDNVTVTEEEGIVTITLPAVMPSILPGHRAHRYRWQLLRGRRMSNFTVTNQPEARARQGRDPDHLGAFVTQLRFEVRNLLLHR